MYISQILDCMYIHYYCIRPLGIHVHVYRKSYSPLVVCELLTCVMKLFPLTGVLGVSPSFTYSTTHICEEGCIITSNTTQREKKLHSHAQREYMYVYTCMYTLYVLNYDTIMVMSDIPSLCHQMSQ